MLMAAVEENGEVDIDVQVQWKMQSLLYIKTISQA